MEWVDAPPEIYAAMMEAESLTYAARRDCRCEACCQGNVAMQRSIQLRLQVASGEAASSGESIPDEPMLEHCEWHGEDREDVEEYGYLSLCPACRDEAGLCDWCESARPEDEIHQMRLGDRVNPISMCETCRDDLRWCCQCERYFTGDAYFPDYDTCEECYNDTSEHMREWNYRPTPIFFGSDDDFHFGVEVELESVSQREVPRVVSEMGSDALYCKSDGSLYSGVEVVTHPGTLTAWQQGEVIPWNAWEEAAEQHFGVQRDRNSAGIHVHVSRTAFNRKGRWSAAHMWKFMQLHYRNEVAFKKLSGRDGSTYANWSQTEDRKVVTPKAKASMGYNHDRYAVINVNNEATVECRYFQSDERKEIILKNVELVHAAVEYTRHLPAKAVKDGLLDYKYFQAWFRRRKERYPNLTEYAEGHHGLVKANRDNQQRLEKRMRMELIRERRRQQHLMRLYAEFGVPVPPNPDNLYWDRMHASNPDRMRAWWSTPHGIIYRQYAVVANSPDRFRTLVFMVRDQYRRFLQSNEVRTYNQPPGGEYDDGQLRTMRAWHAWEVLEAILDTCQMELTSNESALIQGEINSLANWN